MKREFLGIREETTSYIVSYTDFPMGHGEKSEILLVTILQTADTLAARIIGSLLGIALTKDVISMRISL